MNFQYALKTYIDKPNANDDVVIFHNDEVVIIKDKFPKSIAHYLVIPRWKDVTTVHPLNAFHRDYKNFTAIELYDKVGAYVEKAKDMMVEELTLNVFRTKDPDQVAQLKAGFVKAGVHSIPSLKNLHIHVISQDFYSSRMKNKKHFNSFNTSFFVEYHKLNPESSKRYRQLYKHGAHNYADYDSDSHSASSDDDDQDTITLERNETRLNDIIKKTPLRCPYCKLSFQFQFVKLKEHLANEYQKKLAAYDLGSG